MTTAGVVLCGGHSSRFGAPKALAPLLGKPAAAHLLDAMTRADLRPVVAVTGEGGAPAEALRALGYSLVIDDTPLRPSGASGPLCGVVAALGELECPVVFWPVDCPVPPPALLVELAAGSGAVSVEGNPLCARLEPAHLPEALAMLSQGRTGVRDLLVQLGASTLAKARVNAHDPHALHTCCFNTPQELHAAEERVRATRALER
ncbi:MAG: NTP transferase domain-containing protein [Myxococcota bacterium]